MVTRPRFQISIYRTEENFGGKKLWQMDLTADLVKKTLVNLAKSFARHPQIMGGVPKSVWVVQKEYLSLFLMGWMSTRKL